MVRQLDYVRAVKQTSKSACRSLIVFNYITIAYPILVLGFCYSAYLAYWIHTGNEPCPSAPGRSEFGRLGPFENYVFAAFLIAPLVALAGIVGLGVEGVFTNYELRSSLRIVMFTSAWIGAGMVLWWDPLRVAYWWFD